ncbi:hypothetical protein [Deinococcus pimensis]|uniref:hypothetical protein n=1 Tax=Deinococcus pimensis TaxID=309888 RepID=UPI000488DBBC|nr:hypothetical protein [Deinococcus pimensis]
MKNALALVSLMTALAVGSASAAVSATTAGTVITNTATATFDDGAGNPNASVTSNEVKTTVTAQPHFTIAPNTVDRVAITLNPGQYAVFDYTLTNDGNVNGDAYTISSGSLDLATIGGKTVNSGTTPTVYYFTTKPTPANLADPAWIAANLVAGKTTLGITNVAANGGTATFYAVYQIPTTAQAGSIYSSNPQGARTPQTSIPVAGGGTISDGTTAGSTVNLDGNNQNETDVVRTDAVAIGPVSNPTATGSADAQNDILAASVTGATSVTFTQTVQNTGANTDNIALSYSATGLPAGTTVTFKDANGNTLPTTTIGGVTYPVLQNVAPGASLDVQVIVTYPAVTANLTAPVITVQAISTNAVNYSGKTVPQATDATTDNLVVRAATYGDYSAAPVAVTPAPQIDRDGAGNALLTYPMALRNYGTIAEDFTPTATSINVTVAKPDGTTTTVSVPVKYFIGTTEVKPGDTLTVAAGTTQPITAQIVLPPSAVAVYPTVYSTFTQTFTSTTQDVPTVITLSDVNDRWAVTPSGTLDLNPTNDPANPNGKRVVRCAVVAGLPDCSTGTPTTINQAAPGDYLLYTIRMQNVRNVPISNIVVKDVLDSNLTFYKVSAVVANNGGFDPGFAYRFGTTGTWNVLSGTGYTGAASDPELQVRFGNGTGTTSTSALVTNGSITVSIIVQVK